MKDIEIGTFGEQRVYVSVEEIKKIVNKEVLKRLDATIEALKFYAAEENYYMHGTYGKTNVRDDNGKIAREVLNALHVN